MKSTQITSIALLSLAFILFGYGVYDSSNVYIYISMLCIIGASVSYLAAEKGKLNAKSYVNFVVVLASVILLGFVSVEKKDSPKDDNIIEKGLVLIIALMSSSLMVID